MITRNKIDRKLCPSTLASSSCSRGIVRKYWRSKKMLKAPPPNHAGTVSGRYVPTHPSSLYNRNDGTRVTSPGSMIPAITRRKSHRRPGARILAKA